MPRIYIRHGEKAYKNGRPFRQVRENSPEEFRFARYYHGHDPPLTMIGREKATALAEKLLRQFSPPQQIITSPYLRTRETAIAMAELLVRRYAPSTITITCQSDLSEYLGNHPNTPLDVQPETFKYHPPHPETYPEFQERVKKHLDSWTPGNPDEVVWVITHGIFIEEIIRPWYPEEKIPYLGAVIMESPTGQPVLLN